MNFKKSFELLEKSKQFIPGQTQTFSRASTSFVEGAYPVLTIVDCFLRLQIRFFSD